MTKWLKILPILWFLTGCVAILALPLLSGLIPAPAPGGTQVLRVRLNKRHQSPIGFIEKPQMAWFYAIFKLPNFNHV